MKEIIKAVPGYGGRYQVSNLGYLQHTKSGRRVGSLNRDGYLRGTLRDERCVNHAIMVHRLIALAFLPYKEGDTVNHIDGNKLNNRIDNLEFISQADNNRHRSTMRGFVRKKAHKLLTNDQVIEIRSSSLNNQQLGNLFGVSRYIIRDCRLGRTYNGVQYI